jgi:FAD/FMN-containing dehydrogenase
VLAGWQRWGQGEGEEIWSALHLASNAGGTPGPFQVYSLGVSADGIASLAPSVERLVKAVGRDPLELTCVPESYREAMLELADCRDRSIAQCHTQGQSVQGTLERNSFAGSSDIFEQWLPEPGIQALVKAMRERHARGQSGIALLDWMGGVIGRVAPTATAFAHRSAAFTAQYFCFFPRSTSPSVLAESRAWQTSMRATMRPWSSGGAYVNYLDPGIIDWQRAYYGRNYARLAQIKATHDPGGLFRQPQGISADS